jgi:hypothetical protein
MAYNIYVLNETALTISGGAILDGITQGDGSHLVGRTITLNSNAWYPVAINDDDPNFQDNDGSQRLNGAQNINGTLVANNTVLEAEYGLRLTDGVNTWTVVGFNVNNSAPAYATVEGLAFIGGPGGFPPRGVALRVVSAFEGPNFPAASYATPICFAAGTLIDTATGPCPVENITVGTQILTAEDGLQPVRWRSSRQFPAQGRFAPVLFHPGAIGNIRPLRLSPQHRIRVSDWRSELWLGMDNVLVPALHFVNGRDVVIETGGMVDYHHLMFDAHQIIFSEGVATESFHPGEVGLGSLDQAAREEIFAIFPELGLQLGSYGATAHTALRQAEARVLLAA